MPDEADILARLEALEAAQPDNAYRRKADDGHHHYQTLEGMDDEVSQGFGYQLNAIGGLTLERDVWPNNRRLNLKGGGMMNVDYVLDPAGGGSHTTLTAAVAAAIAAGGDKTIWICSSPAAEDAVDLGGIGASDLITLASHSQHSVVLTAKANDDIFKQDTNGGGTDGGLKFRNIGLSIPTADYAAFFVNTGTQIKHLIFEECWFDMGAAGAFTGYPLRMAGSTNGLDAMGLRITNCNGTAQGFFKATGSAAQAPTEYFITYDNHLDMQQWWDGGGNNAAPSVTDVAGGHYTLRAGIEYATGRDTQHFSTLYIVYHGAEPLFKTGASSTGIDDHSYTDIKVEFHHNDGSFGNFGSHSAGQNDGLFIDAVFGIEASGIDLSGGTFLTVDADYLNTHIGDIHAPDFGTLYSGPLTDMDALHYHSIIRDDDNDTLIQVEESADEDIIRFDIEGTERMTLDGTKLDLLNSTYLDANDVQLPLIGSPTFTHVEHINTVFHSSGWISGGAISDAGGATVDVTAGTGAIRATDSTTAQLLFFDWSASNGLAITANSIRYVGVEYNAGSPQVVIRTTDNFDDNTAFLLGTVVNESGTLHIQNAPWKIGDHASAMIQRARGTAPIARDKAVGGLIFSETGTRNVAVTAGALWHGLTSFTIGALDTNPGGAADTFDGYSSQGKEDTGIAAWPNTVYDDGAGGTGSLTTMTNNRWANLWWYLELDGELVMVYGTNQYTSEALAGEEAAPSTLPDRLQVHGTLAARFIFQKSAATASEILSAFDTPFSVLGVTDHGNLAGLGDVAADHPHGISAHISHANWKVLYTDGSGDEQELSLGADGTFLQANGVAAAPTFAAIVVGDIPFDDATSDPLIDADAANDGAEGSPARKDHVHPKHHAKYTDAEAVTALEAEDPFDMAGVLNLAKNLNLTKGVSANIDANDEIAVPAVSWLYLTSAGAADTLSGIGAGAEGQLVFLTVVAGKDITLAHNGAVVAGKPLLLNGEANVTLDQDHDLAIAIYDATATVWNVFVVPGAAGHAEDHKDRHDPEDGADPLDSANAAEISVVVAAGTGTSHSLARADHVHAINHAITDNHLVTIDHAAVADNDYAKFTASGLEGRSFAEVKADLDLEIGTDVLAQQTIGIADNNLLEVDHAAAADNDYAKFTAAGLEGRSYAEVLADLSAQAGAAFDFNNQNVIVASLYLEEKANADADVGNQGQLWMKTGAPSEFMFTDDAGADRTIIWAGGAFHDGFSDFVGNEHIDHTGVTLTAGVGLSGGGDISANRTFTVDLNELGTEVAIAAGDFIAMVDITDSGSQKITFADFEGTIDHGNLAGLGDSDHAAHFDIDGSKAMTGDINLDGNNIDNGGVIFLKEQAAADADVPGSGQIWVKSGSPNTLYFTDEDGTDVQLGAGGGGTPDGTLWLQAHAGSTSPTVSDGYAKNELGAAGTDGNLNLSLVVPADFSSLDGVFVWFFCFGGANVVLRYSVETDWAADGEAYNAASDSIGQTDLTVNTAVNGEMTKLDISAAFTGIAAGDAIGITFNRHGTHANDTVTQCRFLGFEFRWNRA